MTCEIRNGALFRTTEPETAIVIAITITIAVANAATTTAAIAAITITIVTITAGATGLCRLQLLLLGADKCLVRLTSPARLTARLTAFSKPCSKKIDHTELVLG